MTDTEKKIWWNGYLDRLKLQEKIPMTITGSVKIFGIKMPRWLISC